MARTKRMVVGPRTDGARALDRYLRENGVSVPAFCDNNQPERLKIQRLLSGRSNGCDVALALKIQESTSGAVRVEDWSETTVREDAEGEIPLDVDAAEVDEDPAKPSAA